MRNLTPLPQEVPDASGSFGDGQELVGILREQQADQASVTPSSLIAT